MAAATADKRVRLGNVSASTTSLVVVALAALLIGCTAIVLVSIQAIEHQAGKIGTADFDVMRTVSILQTQHARRRGVVEHLVELNPNNAQARAEIHAALKKLDQQDRRLQQTLGEAIPQAEVASQRWPTYAPVAAQLTALHRQQLRLASEQQTMVRLLEEGRTADYAEMAPLLNESVESLDAAIHQLLMGVHLGIERSAIEIRARGRQATVASVTLGAGLLVAGLVWYGVRFGVFREHSVEPLDSTVTEGRSPSAVGGGRLVHKRILVAASGTHNQRLLQACLEGEGAETQLAVNGAQAIDLVAQNAKKGQPVDLVLMDLQMPVLDGLVATQRLRSVGFDRPIVGLASSDNPTARNDCSAAGCDAFLAKPLSRDRVLQVVEEMLANNQQLAGV